MVVLTVGNIGSGKSTLARRLVDYGFMVVNMDSLITMFAGGEYVYKKDNKDVYRDVEFEMIELLVDEGKDVVIDRTNMSAEERSRYIWRIKDIDKGCEIVCVDFGIGDEDGLKRRLADNRGYDEETWKDVFYDMKDRYKKPTPCFNEGFSRIYDISSINDIENIVDLIIREQVDGDCSTEYSI